MVRHNSNSERPSLRRLSTTDCGVHPPGQIPGKPGEIACSLKSLRKYGQAYLSRHTARVDKALLRGSKRRRGIPVLPDVEIQDVRSLQLQDRPRMKIKLTNLQRPTSRTDLLSPVLGQSRRPRPKSCGTPSQGTTLLHACSTTGAAHPLAQTPAHIHLELGRVMRAGGC